MSEAFVKKIKEMSIADASLIYHVRARDTLYDYLRPTLDERTASLVVARISYENLAQYDYFKITRFMEQYAQYILNLYQHLKGKYSCANEMLIEIAPTLFIDV